VRAFEQGYAKPLPAVRSSPFADVDLPGIKVRRTSCR
jgi:hypothetical protein